MMTNIKPITTKEGRMLWEGDDIGPRGGIKKFYTERTAGETRPSPWRFWVATQKDAIGTEIVAYNV